MCFPTCPMSPDNEIDMLPPYLMYPGAQPPVVSAPVVPVQPVVPIGAQPVVPVQAPVVPVVPAEQPVPTL